MPTSPPNVDALPAAPSTNSPSTFSTLMDAFLAALILLRTQLVALAANIYANAVEAFNGAIDAVGAANTAVSAVGNLRWVSGTNYADGAVVWSPIDRRTYRRLGAGAGTADPSADIANWRLISQEPGMRLLGEAVVTSAGQGISAINFLNIFSDEHDEVWIEIYNMTVNAATPIYLRAAVAGAVISGASDYSISTGSPGSNINTTIGTQGFLNISQQAVDSSARGFTATIRMLNVRSTRLKMVDWRGITPTNDPALYVTGYTGAIFNAGVLSGFQIAPATATVFGSAVVRVYGLRNK